MFDITTSSFGLSGSLTSTGGATIVEKGFVYSTSDSTPTVGEGATKVLVGPYTAGQYDTIVSGANDGVTYYARAYVSSSGCEEYGDTVSGSTPTEYYAVTLEYGSVSREVVCANFGSNPSGTFYVDVGSPGSGVFAISSFIYLDPLGANPAPAYFYTDGTDVRDADGSGNLGATSGCS